MSVATLRYEFRSTLAAWGVPAASAFAALVALDRWPDWRLAGDPVDAEAYAGGLVLLGLLPLLAVVSRPVEACQRIRRHAVGSFRLAVAFAAAHAAVVAVCAAPGVFLVLAEDLVRGRPGGSAVPGALARLGCACLLGAPWAALVALARASGRVARLVVACAVASGVSLWVAGVGSDVPFFVDRCLRSRILGQSLIPQVALSASTWAGAGVAMSWLALRARN